MGWTIVDGRLYLNLDADLNNTFANDATRFIPMVDENWGCLNT